jgi:hypothetical protein
MMFHEGKKIKKVEGVPPPEDQKIKNIEADGDGESGGNSNPDSKRQTVIGTTSTDPEKTS